MNPEHPEHPEHTMEEPNEFTNPSVPTVPTTTADHEMVIIPSVVERKIDDIEVEAILMDTATEADDQHQHYFSDQLTFERPRWSRPGFSTLGMIAVAVDVTNYMEFPTTVADNGGICYIAVYLVCSICCAYPFLYLEAVVGQYFQTAMIGIWGICPLAKGLGLGLFYLVYLLIQTFSANTVWAVLMVGSSFQSAFEKKPIWVSCDNDWNTCRCNNTRQPDCLALLQHRNSTNSTSTSSMAPEEEQTPAFEHFVGRVLRMWKSKYADKDHSDSIVNNGKWSEAYGFNNPTEGIGILILDSSLTMSTILVILLVFCMVNIKFVAYIYGFTTIYCLIVTALMFCRAVTLEGAFNGLKMYMKPKPAIFYDLKVWNKALLHCLFSPGCGTGMYIVLSSYNPLQYNVKYDVTIAIFTDILISLVGSVIGFMFIGHLYSEQLSPVPEKFPGDEFIFVALPEAIGVASGSAFFSICFYTMIICVSFDTSLVTLRCIAFSMYEEYKRKFPTQKVSRFIFTFTPWVLTFILTIMNTTRGGYWVYSFFRYFLFKKSMMFLMVMQIITFSWLWGIEEICTAGETVIGHRPSLMLRILWKFVIPLILVANLVQELSMDRSELFTVFNMKPPEFMKYVGRASEFLSYATFVAYAIYSLARLCKKGRSLKVILLMWISPEYEHQEILEGPKGRKRSSCKHFVFMKFPDEKCSTLIKSECDYKCFRTKKDATVTNSKSTKGDHVKWEEKKKKSDHEKVVDEGDALDTGQTEEKSRTLSLWALMEAEHDQVPVEEHVAPEEQKGESKAKKKKPEQFKSIKKNKVKPMKKGKESV